MKEQAMASISNSFLSPKLEVRANPAKGGQGLYARQPLQADEVVLIWGGRTISADELTQVPDERRHCVVQIEEGFYTITIDPPEPTDYINHSCNANAGLRGQVVVVAMRDIEAGEEVCFDYAMTDDNPYDEFECACGAPDCRGWVTGNDWKRPELWERYAGYFSAYLQRRIDRLKRGLADVPAGSLPAADEIYKPTDTVRWPR